jgi:hypothetical protein
VRRFIAATFGFVTLLKNFILLLIFLKGVSQSGSQFGYAAG